MNPENIALSQVVERLQRLETQNHRLKVGGTLLLLMIGAGLLIGAKAAAPLATTVQAERFVLVDAAGKEIAVLGPDDGKRPGLSIKDAATGKEKAWLGLWGTAETGLGLFDAAGKERLWVGLSDGTKPRVVLYDPEGKETWSTP